MPITRSHRGTVLDEAVCLREDQGMQQGKQSKATRTSICQKVREQGLSVMRSARRATVLAILALLVGFAVDRAVAYTTEDEMKPTNLWIRLVLNAPPLHNNFTRYLTFVNRAGLEKAVAVAFVKTSNLHYTGTVTTSGLATLQTLADQNNRSYWDVMSFENKGGTTALDINQIFVEVEYAQTCCGREQVAQIGYMVSQYLDAGYDSFPIAAHVGRTNYAQDYLGLTYTELMALPAPLRSFIYDIGKSGSSDASDSASATNPKYGLSGSSLCSETVSWYYYEHSVRLTDQLSPWIQYDFRAITSHAVMHDQFLAADRLYCYHAGQRQWVKQDLAYNWVLGDTYTPRPGDYLDRPDSDGNAANGDDGHAMMLVAWDAAAGLATTLDGPWNINFRPVDVEAEESSGFRDYCVGRIPAND